MPLLSEVVSTLKKMAPLSLAGSWDNVGLLIEPAKGALSNVSKVFLTIDLTEDVLDEAERYGANLIVSYHPPIFSPIKRITLDTWKGRITSRCLHLGMAVYSPHTTWDTVDDGLNDWLISCLEGTVTPILAHPHEPQFSHFVVLLSPTDAVLSKTDLDQSLSAFKDGIDYKFLEHKISPMQLLCNDDVRNKLLELTKTRDFYFHSSRNEEILCKIKKTGIGRHCSFTSGLSIRNVIEKIKAHLSLTHVMVAMGKGASLSTIINSAAAVAGSGGSVLKGCRADLFVTGEMSHHDILDAVHNGVTVVLANHTNTERGYLTLFRDRMIKEMPTLDVRVSEVDADPLVFI